MKPMPPEIKQWVEALRSGKYKQGRGQLRFKNEYCCLGVLCDISKLGKWVSQDGFCDYEYTTSSSQDSCTSSLPSPVMEWANLRSVLGRFNPRKNSTTLVKINDDRGKSFVEIADIIEKNWEKMVA